jgi:NADH-quinone oxidoreductase subunit H
VAVNAQSLYDWGDGALDFVFNSQARIPAESIVYCYDDPGCSGVYPIVFSLILFLVVLTGFAYTTLLERKLLGWLQSRVGPNRVGPGGVFQPVADGIKLIFKEDIMPARADRAIWMIAPVIKAVPILILFAVIPWGPNIIVPWFAPSLGDVWFEVPLGLADPNVGALWLLAITSLGTYGVVLAGWSSASKYAMLGGLRSSAQMISYELSLGLALVVPILLASSMSLGDMVRGQTFIWEWYVFQNPLAAIILMIALLAEVNRAPFDLPEAEQELTQGYQTEYSGMKFALFMMAEYLGMIAVSMIVATTFLGGYSDGFGLVQSVPLLGPLVLFGKVVLLLAGMIWVRATLPRIRYDRLMALGWKVMLPLALVAVIWTAVAIVIAESFASPIAYGIAAGIMFVALLAAVFFLTNRRGQTLETDDALDPMITGQRGGVGYAALNVVGGLLAVPFGLYHALLGVLDRVGTVGEQPESTTAIEKTPKN